MVCWTTWRRNLNLMSVLRSGRHCLRGWTIMVHRRGVLPGFRAMAKALLTKVGRLCGIVRGLDDELDRFQISDPKIRKAVKSAILRAPPDDPVLIVLWDENRLNQAPSGAEQARRALLNLILGFPSCTAVPAAPREVFNFRNGDDLTFLFDQVRAIHPWAVGGVGQSVARTIVISDTKKNPSFLKWGLFGG